MGRNLVSWVQKARIWESVLNLHAEGDVFVARYEDLCVREAQFIRDLVSWEPRLADVDFRAQPGRHRAQPGRHLASHDQVALHDYCEIKAKMWEAGTLYG